MGDTVGANIKRIRMERGLTQTQLAERMYGDSRRQGYISNVESGRFRPDISTLLLFADALACPIADIQPLASYVPDTAQRTA